ncbi:helix-turn-helix transcriptional regulator [Tumebacillus permanentifrigoris]|uniref:Helix-turn-helix protein n=1 Tax=Tumebacillus permanentifrigoris TaxID=378543 RepID=A0A316DEM1_9BACL|nr:helix-turn-helix transcriptional regulator [Tumebacillus permanentifrigoris]PWK14417.1 helix-turn-helix protein [Tumebacillus permanentifrigoris]
MQAWKHRQAVQIGRNIRERRKELGLTQGDLARELFSVQSISLIERGKLKVTPETLAALSERLQCSVDDLLVMHDLQEDWLDELLQLVLRYQATNQLHEATESAHTLYTESLAKNNTKYLQESTYYLCFLYNSTSKYNVSNEWGRELLALHAEVPNHMHLDRILNIYTTLGNNYYMLGKTWDAYDLLREAEKLVEESHDTSEQAGKLYYHLAIIKQLLRNWEGCIWYCERSLPIFEQHDMIINIGKTQMMLGNAYMNQNRNDKAQYHLERSIRILSQTSDVVSLARCYHNLGELELRMKQYDKARKSYNRSIKLKRQVKDIDGIQNTLRMLAKISIHDGLLDEARAYLDEALLRAQEMDNALQIAHTWRHLGDLAQIAGQEDDFTGFYKKAIEQYDRLGCSTELAESAEKLGEYFLEKGRGPLAIPYLQKALRNYRKLFNNA